jgi:uncharacterized protein (DUF1697 family)
MNSYVAFIRAINVGGRAVVHMTDVRDAFVRAGCEGVRTYIQSGNVLFDCAQTDVRGLCARVSARLAELTGTKAAMAVRGLAELEKLVRAAPFKDFENDSSIKLYVAFLASKPPVKPKLPLISAREALEAFAMKSLDVFILSRPKPNGFYGFPNNFVEKEMAVQATTRNWNTVQKILHLSREVVRS